MDFDLGCIPYFRGIDAQGLMLIEQYMHQHSYQAGATIFTEAEDCAGFHVVLEGLVRIYRISSEGRLHTISLLRPYSSFNEVAAVDGGPNPHNAAAVTNVEVLTISHERLLELMGMQSVLMSNYVQSLAHLNREYIERLEDMTFRTIPSRLAKLFLHESSYADQISEAPTALTQEEIASILGTTREVVGRALRGLLNAGLLSRRGRNIYVADREGLEYLAETNILRSALPDRSS